MIEGLKRVLEYLDSRNPRIHLLPRVRRYRP
jgi:hypothetical protein